MAFPDLLVMVDRLALDVMGESVTYAAEFGDPVTVTGILDVPDANTSTGTVGGPIIENVRPQVFFRLSDLPSDPDEDTPTITARGIEYRVRERQKDGQGGIILFLAELET